MTGRGIGLPLRNRLNAPLHAGEAWELPARENRARPRRAVPYPRPAILVLLLRGNAGKALAGFAHSLQICVN